MPTAAQRPCAQPGCRNLVASGRCPAHAASHRKARYEQYDSNRGTRSERGYDATWYRFLRGFRQGIDLNENAPDFADQLLARNQCQCGCKVTSGLEYDHITPLSQGGERLDPSNVAPLCHRAHTIKTARERQGRPEGDV